MATQNNFDFDSYNALMKGVGTGLKLHLGVQLLRDVATSLDYFDNPLAAEIGVIVSDLKTFHATYKAKAKEIAAKKENPSERNSSIDDSTKITPDTVANMMAMMEQFSRMMAFQKQGELTAAQNAERGIQEIKDGALNAGDETKTGTEG